MKLLLDFFPILLFFGAFKLYDIYTATGVLMAATVAADGDHLVHRAASCEPMQKATLVLILLFGDAHAGCCTTSASSSGSRRCSTAPWRVRAGRSRCWGFKKNFLKMLLGAQLELPDAVWRA